MKQILILSLAFFLCAGMSFALNVNQIGHILIKDVPSFFFNIVPNAMQGKITGQATTSVVQTNNNAQSIEDKKHPTGLIEPTPEEEKWLKENVPVIQNIRLNQLALDRINAEQKSKGLKQAALSNFDIADLGKEATFDANTADKTVTTTSISSSIMPSFVDNSESPAFPEIGDQGVIGACVAFATTYYQMTYETNLALGRTATSGDNIFSPKWTYSLLNPGIDEGISYASAYNLEKRNGVATLNEVPYDWDYISWNTDPKLWRDAINHRAQNFAQIVNPNTDALLDDMKTVLLNGHLISIETSVWSWTYYDISDDPATTEGDDFVGQHIIGYSKDVYLAQHAMTVVGYNDKIWTDLNGNGKVDAGEKGAFKLANSWGKSWGNNGYVWVAYDALKPTSNVISETRSSYGVFKPEDIFTLSVTPYTPTMLAAVTLKHQKRGQMYLDLETGSTSSSVSTNFWNSEAFKYHGGDYPVEGTFYFDFTKLDKSGTEKTRWFVRVCDSVTGDPAIISSFKLYQVTRVGDSLVATSTNVPKTIDYDDGSVWLDYDNSGSNQPPVAEATTSVTGKNPLKVTFDGSKSRDADGQIVGYSWNFGDGTDIGTGSTVSHTFKTAGQYNAALMVTDNEGKTASDSVAIMLVKPPNTAPALDTIGNKEVSSGMTLTFSISGSDADGDTLTYSVSNLPSGATFDATTQTFSWTPNRMGTYKNIKFLVSDGQLTDFENITITVSKANHLPILSRIRNKTVTVGDKLKFIISATDLDKEDKLTYSASNLPTGAIFNPTTKTFLWIPDATQAAIYKDIYFQVSDKKSITGQKINISVNPKKAPCGDYGDVNFDDFIDSTDYQLVTNFLSKLVQLSAKQKQMGDVNCDGTLDGEDANLISGYVSSSILTFKVCQTSQNNKCRKLVNAAPVLAPIGSKTAVVGQTLSFTISGSDANSDILTYSAGNLPSGARFDQKTQIFTWTPTKKGTYINTIFQVSDGILTDKETVKFVVKPA
jgi:C1A family cysteine protease/PKD repeat protein